MLELLEVPRAPGADSETEPLEWVIPDMAVVEMLAAAVTETVVAMAAAGLVRVMLLEPVWEPWMLGLSLPAHPELVQVGHKELVPILELGRNFRFLNMQKVFFQKPKQ